LRATPAVDKRWSLLPDGTADGAQQTRQLPRGLPDALPELSYQL
jgi:hypothetical protein